MGKKDIIYRDGIFFDRTTGEFWNENKDNLQRQGKNDVFLDLAEYHLEMDFVFTSTNLNFTPLPKDGDSNKGTVSSGLATSIKKDKEKKIKTTTINTPRGTVQINQKRGSSTGNDILLIPFQFFKIKSINDRTPSYNEIGNLFSRFEKINVWQNTSNLSFELEITYVAIDPKIYNEDWVDSMVALYRSLVLPVYIGGVLFSPPPRIFLKLGDYINNVPCIVTQMSRGEIIEGAFTNKQSSIYSDSTGNYLPKYQTLNLSLTTAYIQSKDNKYIDFKKVINRDEGISETYSRENFSFKEGIKRGTNIEGGNINRINF